MYRLLFILLFALFQNICCCTAIAQHRNAAAGYTVSGRFLDMKSKETLPFAVISTENNTNWTAADKDGRFTLKNIAPGEQFFYLYLLGYVDRVIKINVTGNIRDLDLLMEPVSLELNEVVITADTKKKKSNASSTYTIDRTAMDHLQATNITDVMSLLPGGKFKGDRNLTNSDASFEIRGGKGEMNSASFATAVEVDGVRMNNNADFGKLKGIDNRSLPVTNVESVEIVTGIPSVEYGDLNSGLVKINTSKGRTPFVIELLTRPNTKLASIRKGFNIGYGTLNASLERARSISSLISPYTSYVRNGLTLNYTQRLNRNSEKPLSFHAGFSGNLGGYNSKEDPDRLGNSYEKVKENGLRAHLGLQWSPGSRILSHLEWKASLTYTDKLQTTNSLQSSPSSQVAVHTEENGYYVAEDYDSNPNADVILLKPGHWYELGYFDDKPIYFSTKVKADSKNYYGERIFNHVMLGAEYSYAHNLGRGEYYDDMRLAPTWREYLLYEKPAMNNISIFLEDNLDIRTTSVSHLKLMAGIRSDITLIKGSEYGTVSAFSPRFNLQYIFWENRPQTVSDLEIHAGWGKAVKLPSFNILYPRPNYIDLNTFTSASNAENIAFTAYKTEVNTSLFNRDLRWQSSNQFEIGARTKIAGIEISLLFYRNVVHDTYTRQSRFRPFSYKYTGPSALEGIPIPSKDRIYAVDRNSGIISVSDRNGRYPVQQLSYTTYDRFISDNIWVNGSPAERMGIEYFINFPKIDFLNLQFRLDGNWYRYKGIDQVMSQNYPGMYMTMSDGRPYRYIGHYVGPASAANGSETQEANLNVMVSAHIPKIRLIISLRLETTLMNRSQNLSYYSGGNRSYALASNKDFISQDPDIYKGGTYVVTYPLYYSTWDEPEKMIPFMEKYLWAEKNDRNLFNDLTKLVEKSNYSFLFDPNIISPYYSMNLNITKEIGDIASVSFYATNFLNNMQKIHSTWGNIQESNIYNKGYIPSFYYGLSVRLKF